MNKNTILICDWGHEEGNCSYVGGRQCDKKQCEYYHGVKVEHIAKLRQYEGSRNVVGAAPNEGTWAGFCRYNSTVFFKKRKGQ